MCALSERDMNVCVCVRVRVRMECRKRSCWDRGANLSSLNTAHGWAPKQLRLNSRQGLWPSGLKHEQGSVENCPRTASADLRTNRAVENGQKAAHSNKLEIMDARF